MRGGASGKFQSMPKSAGSSRSLDGPRVAPKLFMSLERTSHPHLTGSSGGGGKREAQTNNPAENKDIIFLHSIPSSTLFANQSSPKPAHEMTDLLFPRSVDEVIDAINCEPTNSKAAAVANKRKAAPERKGLQKEKEPREQKSENSLNLREICRQSIEVEEQQSQQNQRGLELALEASNKQNSMMQLEIDALKEALSFTQKDNRVKAKRISQLQSSLENALEAKFGMEKQLQEYRFKCTELRSECRDLADRLEASHTFCSRLESVHAQELSSQSAEISAQESGKRKGGLSTAKVEVSQVKKDLANWKVSKERVVCSLRMEKVDAEVKLRDTLEKLHLVTERMEKERQESSSQLRLYKDRVSQISREKAAEVKIFANLVQNLQQQLDEKSDELVTLQRSERERFDNHLKKQRLNLEKSLRAMSQAR